MLSPLCEPFLTRVVSVCFDLLGQFHPPVSKSGFPDLVYHIWNILFFESPLQRQVTPDAYLLATAIGCFVND
jgi:hypothetical protein